MKCFELVQRVLDETYAEIPGDEGERDAKIAQALKEMSHQYNAELRTSGGPDFSDPVTRFAYVFRYVPSHSHWLYELIDWSEEAQALFAEKRLRVTCLGGGPGSDLVGVLKYMSKSSRSPALFCEIVDGCLQWKQTWSDLAFNLELGSPLHTDYVIHDVGDPDTWRAPSSFQKSDLFTVNFFASEIYHLGDVASKYLKFSLGQAKEGAILLMNDNNHSDFYRRFDAIAESAGFQAIMSKSGTRKIYDVDERADVLGRFAKKFDGYSKLTGDLAWRVFQKA